MANRKILRFVISETRYQLPHSCNETNLKQNVYFQTVAW